MKKNTILLISVLMAVALIGLIYMQITWIRHDYTLREEKFGQQVTTAINNAVAKLETRESVHIIARNMNNSFLEDSIKAYFSELEDLPDLPEAISVFEPVLPESLMFHENNSYTFTSDFDTLFNGEMKIVTHHSDQGEDVSVSVNSLPGKSNTTITTVKIKERMREAGEMSKEASKMAAKAREELELRQVESRKAMVAQAREKVRQKVKKMNTVFEKMAVEYDRRSFDLMDRVSPVAVDSLISLELSNNGIRLPYTIALQNGVNDSIVWQRSDTNLAHSDEKEFAALLFPGDITNRNDLVKVSFADTFNYFISSMWVMLLSSALFTGIVMVAFAYTLIIIFRQKKLSDIKNDFINNMTHEFKTPIATIRLATEAITNPEVIRDPEKIRHYSSIIRDENSRMNAHVENILQIAQFDKRSFAQDVTETDMHEVIRESVDKMKLITEQRGGQVNFSLMAEKTKVNADPRFICMAMMNLLDNALKYTEKPPQIDIHTINRDDKIIISVTDNGIGMKPEMSQRIFEKFYRVPSGNLHNVKGFGLGLSYVKAIVTAHEGTVTVESQPGKGSCFEITLPIA